MRAGRALELIIANGGVPGGLVYLAQWEMLSANTPVLFSVPGPDAWLLDSAAPAANKAPKTFVVEVVLASTAEGAKDAEWVAAKIRAVQALRLSRSMLGSVGEADEWLTSESVAALGQVTNGLLGQHVAAELTKFLTMYTTPTWNQSGQRGALLHGDPGVGKSHIMAIARDTLQIRTRSGNVVPMLERVLFSGSGADFAARYWGDAEQKVHNDFAPARNDPKRLFIHTVDEVDVIATDKEGPNAYQPEHKSDLRVKFREEISRNVNVICLATTNKLHKIDEPMKRWGRYGTWIHVLPPPRAKRETTWWPKVQATLRQLARGDDVLLNVIRDTFLQQTASFSCAQLNEVTARLTAWFASPTFVPSRFARRDEPRRMTASEALLDALLQAATKSPSTTGRAKHVMQVLFPRMLSKDGALINATDVAKVSELLETTKRAFTTCSPPMRRRTVLCARGIDAWHWDAHATGRIQIHMPDKCLIIERAAIGGAALDPVVVKLPTNDADSSFTVAAAATVLGELFASDWTCWVDGGTRKQHASDFESHLTDMLEQARFVDGPGIPMIVVHVNEVAEFSLESFQSTISSNASTSVGTSSTSSHSNSWGTSVALAQSLGFSIAHQTSRSTTNQTGVSTSRSKTTSQQSTTSRQTTKGSNKGVSLGLDLLSVSAGKNKSSTTAESCTTGVSETATEESSKSTAVTDSSGVTMERSGQVSVQNQESSMQEVSSAEANNQGMEESHGASATLTTRAQFPRELAAVARLFNTINRQRNERDPFVVLVFDDMPGPRMQTLASPATSAVKPPLALGL